MEKIVFTVREMGGEGSGNWGHAGRPGEVGGSTPPGPGTSGSAPAIARRRKIPPDTRSDREAARRGDKIPNRG